jgi:hypothetical protein
MLISIAQARIDAYKLNTGWLFIRATKNAEELLVLLNNYKARFV